MLHSFPRSSLLTTLETIPEPSKIGIGCFKNSTSPGAQSSVCVPDRVVLDDRLTDIKYMTPGRVMRNSTLGTLLATLCPFGKWSKNLMGLGLFGSIGKCFTIPNCLMSSN